MLQQGSGPDYRWAGGGAACRALRDGVWGIRFGVGKPGRGVQPPLREAHPLGARICAGCPVRRPCAQDTWSTTTRTTYPPESCSRREHCARRG